MINKTNKLVTYLLLSTSLWVTITHATTLIPIATNPENSDIRIKHITLNKTEQFSNTFLSDEQINMSFTLTIADSDVGKSGHLFLVAQYQDKFYHRTSDNLWKPWNGSLSNLLAFKEKTLSTEETISVLSSEHLTSGEFLVYAGYQAADNQSIYYNKTPATLAIFDQQSARLHRIKNKPLLSEFLARSSAASFIPLSVDFSFSPAVESGNDAAISTTNLQETGVDEADRIKTSQNLLYTIEQCSKDNPETCLSSYSLTSSPAASSRLQKLNLNLGNYDQGNLYLTNTDNQQILYIGNSNSQPIFSIWHNPYFWQNNRLDIKFIDAEQSQNMQISSQISLDSSLLSSRLIDNVLYLVTRKNSFFDNPLYLQNSSINSEDEPTSPEEEQTLEDLLPHISFDDFASKTPLVDATDCFIPSQNSSKPIDNTLVTITAIPLSDPSTHYSVCVAGAVDTFYMSTQALYLASSRYPYQVNGNEIIFPDNTSDQQTEIHKFSIASNNLEYKGSATVPGHLGWEADKQPFRMGENEGILKVATSKGQVWDNTAHTRVAVLQENAVEQKLEEISFLDNLGKPGEKLYAARFIKNRGYLVTFKVIDPLFVLDFTNPQQPQILGELEINGYSDYLHPIGENYLLGLGKDAIADVDQDRGAWYQGIKLSLFDVSSGENLREIKSLILGKRGTESVALYDHHAFTWLANGDQATLALPIELNNQETSFSQDFSQPNAYYEWTHTGLYTFNIDTGTNPDIELTGRLITDVSPQTESNQPFTYSDRAVIQGDSVHYIHNNEVVSAEITELNE